MSRNPLLTDRAFAPDGASPAREWSMARERSALGPVGGGAGMGPSMTIGGTVAACAVMFAVLLVGAVWGWTTVDVVERPGGPVAELGAPWVGLGALVGALVLAVATSLRPRWAKVTGVAYAALEGVVLGMVSALYQVRYEGVVGQAVLATLGVFLVMLVLYGLRVLRATPRFVKGVVAATAGIALGYLVVFVLNLFGFAGGFWTSGSPLGLAVSVVVVCVAALNLVLDFDFIERGAAGGLPRYMDWYAGFGLLVTLVWLYLEMLRLLGRVRNG